MRMIAFAERNIKELLRDPMSLVFCILLPLFFLIIFQQFNIPVEQYSIGNFTPSIILFSFSFISLFTANLVARDRSTSLLSRLFSSPMKPIDYILGYSLALLPLTITQSVFFFATGILLGLHFSINILWAILVLIPISILFIGLGVLVGCISTDKSSGPLGSIVIQLVAFTSGMWFSIDLAGKVFGYICKGLPFIWAADLTRGVLASNVENLFLSILIIFVYICGVYALTMAIFKRKMKSDSKQ